MENIQAKNIDCVKQKPVHTSSAKPMDLSVVEKPMDSSEQKPINVDNDDSVKCVLEGGEEQTQSGTQDDDKADEFAYIQREGFTSEIFKIEVKNFQKNVNNRIMKNFLTNKDLKPKKVKIIHLNHESKAYISFTCEEDREQAISLLNGLTWKNRQLCAKKAAPKADPFQMKRKWQEQDSGGSVKKSSKTDEEDNMDPIERLKNTVTPLWKLSYEDQLQKKYNEMADVLRKLGRMIDRNNRTLLKWYLLQKRTYKGMCCPLEPVLPSPVREGYRNKCEFTIGRSLDGKERVVGFRAGKYRDGTCQVGEPTCCTNVPVKMLQVVKRVESFIRASEYDIFEPELNEGYWRMLTVRTTVTGQAMAILDFHPQKLNQTAVDKVKNDLKAHFSTPGEGAVTSLFFHLNSQKTTVANDLTPYELILGEQQITETLSGLKFQISPLAFFQVNTAGAEVLYERVGDLCGATEDSTVLDVCCGTGTIGLTMAKRVKKVIGVEMVQSAIDDAKHNARVNGVENGEYRCGKAEDVMPDLMEDLRGQNLAAVVDPPRAGLNVKVIQAIRKCEALKSLVYVSCNPEQAMNNFVDLCRLESKRIRGLHFIPVKAICVDLFPDTTHCELVILFQRYDPDIHMTIQIEPKPDAVPQPQAEIEPKLGAVPEPQQELESIN